MPTNGNKAPVGHRIRAAMELAGIGSFSELAELVDERGLGERTLRKLADDSDTSRAPQRRDLLAIAGATGLPYAFFVTDFNVLRPITELWPSRSNIEALHLDDVAPEEIVARAMTKLAYEAIDSRPRTADEISDLKERIDGIEVMLRRLLQGEDGSIPAPGGEFGRIAQGEQPIREGPPGTDSDQDTDSQLGTG